MMPLLSQLHPCLSTSLVKWKEGWALCLKYGRVMESICIVNFQSIAPLWAADDVGTKYGQICIVSMFMYSQLNSSNRVNLHQICFAWDVCGRTCLPLA